MMQTVAGTSLLTSVPTIDAVLHDHASELGHDFIAYRNHVYRVVNLCAVIVKAAHGRAAWIAEIERMIADHHKITPSHANHDSLVEPFRRADWIDVTRGLRTFGLPRPLIRPVLARWPSAGFHWRLVQLTLERFLTHPLSPLPMVKL
jgi:hypothetical protein